MRFEEQLQIKAADISADDFLCYKLRIAPGSVGYVSGEYTSALEEFREHQEFSCTMRCKHNDDALLEIDDDFRQNAKSKKLHLNDCIQEVLADKYLHFSLQKPEKQFFSGINRQQLFLA